jgi:segregation and condensation protein B
LYGTSAGFLQLFGLSSLKDLPTLREFTELNEESRRTVERELGETMEEQLGGVADDGDRPTLESAGNVQSQSEAPRSAEHPHGEGDEADEDDDDEDDDDDDDDEDDEDDEDEA